MPLLCIMLWQEWQVFLNYKAMFFSPVNYVKTTYNFDYITQYGNRYNEAKQLFSVPIRASYIGESPEENNGLSGMVMHYYLTQYNLAPSVILNEGDVQDTIIYNLYNSIHLDTANFYLKNGWHVVRDFNNGLVVLAK